MTIFDLCRISTAHNGACGTCVAYACARCSQAASVGHFLVSLLELLFCNRLGYSCLAAACGGLERKELQASRLQPFDGMIGEQQPWPCGPEAVLLIVCMSNVVHPCVDKT